MVLFYEDWCPFCAAFLPVYEKHTATAGFPAWRVRSGDVPKSEEAHGVQVVPTVIVFDNGKPAMRLDGMPGRGLTEKQLKDFMSRCGFPAQ